MADCCIVSVLIMNYLLTIDVLENSFDILESYVKTSQQYQCVLVLSTYEGA